MVLNNTQISTINFIKEQFNTVLQKNRKSYRTREVICAIKLTQLLSDNIKKLLSAEDIITCVSVITELFRNRKQIDKKYKQLNYLEFALCAYDIVFTIFINNKLEQQGIHLESLE